MMYLNVKKMTLLAQNVSLEAIGTFVLIANDLKSDSLEFPKNKYDQTYIDELLQCGFLTEYTDCYKLIDGLIGFDDNE